MAWKDEAFELWDQWARMYPKGTPSFNLVQSVSDSWYLMNVVENNFKEPNGIFDALGLNVN